MTDRHFAWAMGAGDENCEGLRLPPGNLEAPDVLAWLQRTSSDIAGVTGTACWLIVDNDEAVGLISFKTRPVNGLVEIGYGVSESHREKGHATRAVALIAAEAALLGLRLTAETFTANIASSAVLLKNGFETVGSRIDEDEGPMSLWRQSP